MKPRLVILSDLWGRQEANWLNAYSEQLSPYFDLHYYDCCDLGGINLIPYTEKHLHEQFVNGGIDKAVERLLLLENDEVNILAFSLGGAIAWKAKRSGLKMKRLYAISSTRLRYETDQLNAKVSLYFGEDDAYRPSDEWLENMAETYQVIKNEGHLLYSNPKYITMICDFILDDFKK